MHERPKHRQEEEVSGETWGGGELERGESVFLPPREVISPKRGSVMSSEAHSVLRQ